MSSGGAEDDIPQAERKTVTDFCYLLDKSKQLFNGLRLVHVYQNCFGKALKCAFEHVSDAEYVTSILNSKLGSLFRRSSLHFCMGGFGPDT